MRKMIMFILIIGAIVCGILVESEGYVSGMYPSMYPPPAPPIMYPVYTPVPTLTPTPELEPTPMPEVCVQIQGEESAGASASNIITVIAPEHGAKHSASIKISSNMLMFLR